MGVSVARWARHTVEVYRRGYDKRFHIWSRCVHHQVSAVAAGRVDVVRVLGLLDWATAADRSWFFEEVVPASPNLLFLFTTVAPHDALKSFPASWSDRRPDNVMVGVVAQNQFELSCRGPYLLDVPARKFLQLDELTGPVTCEFDAYGYRYSLLTGEEQSPAVSRRREPVEWVVVGGATDPGYPCDVAWIRGVVGECVEFDVPLFVSHLGRAPVTRDPERESRLGVHAPRGSAKPFASHYGCCLIRDAQGADMEEWPAGLADLKVRELPRLKGG